MRNLTITTALTVLVVWSMTGCVSQAGTVRATTDPRVDELAQKQELLTLRMNELAQRLLDVQARLNQVEDFSSRPAEQETPKREVVKLQPPTVETVPVAKAVPAGKAQPVRQPGQVGQMGQAGQTGQPGQAGQTGQTGQTGQAAQKRVQAVMDAPTRAYQSAYTLYRKGQYAKAILDFEDFVGQYPNHGYADSAQFWIGESYFSQGVYEQAIVEFNRVVNAYPQGKRAPDGLLMIGDAYEKLGQPDRARAIYNRLIAQYPASEAAYMAKKRNNTP